MKATLTLLHDGSMMLSIPTEIYNKIRVEDIETVLTNVAEWGKENARVLVIPFECEIIDMREHK